MSSNRSAAGVTVFEGRIYVSGGHDGLQIFNSVSRFPKASCRNPSAAGSWEVKLQVRKAACPLPTKPKMPRAFTPSDFGLSRAFFPAREERSKPGTRRKWS